MKNNTTPKIDLTQLVFVKRTKHISLKNISKNPMLTLNCHQSRFSINQSLASLLQVDSNDGLMFAFNKKEKIGYIMKKNEIDSFIIKRRDKNYLRFSAKDLKLFFIEVFDLTEKKKGSYYFIVDEIQNNKKMFQFKLKK